MGSSDGLYAPDAEGVQPATRDLKFRSPPKGFVAQSGCQTCQFDLGNTDLLKNILQRYSIKFCI